jgi:hypothetical protein
MVSDSFAEQWRAEAQVNLVRYLDSPNPAGHLAAIVLARLADRMEPASPPTRNDIVA